MLKDYVNKAYTCNLILEKKQFCFGTMTTTATSTVTSRMDRVGLRVLHAANIKHSTKQNENSNITKLRRKKQSWTIENIQPHTPVCVWYFTTELVRIERLNLSRWHWISVHITSVHIRMCGYGGISVGNDSNNLQQSIWLDDSTHKHTLAR